MPGSRASPASQGAGATAARCGPAIEEVMRWQALQALGRHPPKVRGSAVPGNYLVAPPKPGRVRLLLGWPVGQSWLQPPVVVLTLSWAWMARPALAGTAALLRPAGRWLRLRSEGRAQTLP